MFFYKVVSVFYKAANVYLQNSEAWKLNYVTNTLHVSQQNAIIYMCQNAANISSMQKQEKLLTQEGGGNVEMVNYCQSRAI